MAKKYKLIETYPHPAFELEIGMVVEQKKGYYYTIDSSLIPMRFGKEIENYPRYWESITEEIDLTEIVYSVDDMEEAFDTGVTTGLADFSNKYTGVDFSNWIKAYTKQKLEGE